MEQLEELFPDEIVAVPQYRSFVNQPERIQISSQEDMLDYDPATLTSYYRFKVALPRPALDCKSIQLARASIPTPTASLPDTECTFWYYALPPVANGGIYPDVGGNPGPTPDFIFLRSGVIADANTGIPVEGDIDFAFGILQIQDDVYAFDEAEAAEGDTYVAIVDENEDTVAWIYYIGSSLRLADRQEKYLHYVRLLPSTTQPDLLTLGAEDTAFGFNKIFGDYNAPSPYASLVEELNKACIDDPLQGTVENDTLFTFNFVSQLISFSLSPRFNRISMRGLNTFLKYLPVASDDELWYASAIELKQRDIDNITTNQGVWPQGAVAPIQPYVEYRNLNLRLGFNYATYPSGVNYFSMIRPYPEYGNPQAYAFEHLAPGYIDLVNTACCHLYTDITGGSTIDSIAQKALLATIPLNTPPVGVAYHSLPLSNPLTKISNQLYEIYIEMRTDTGQPYYIGNNAIVSLEFILTY